MLLIGIYEAGHGGSNRGITRSPGRCIPGIQPETGRNRVEINAILGAVAGAIVGAIVWAVIAVSTGYEIGWIAWGVGGAVGYGAYALEGRGKTSGIVCALLAAVAILSGKYMVIHHFVNQELTQIADTSFSEEYYNELKADAADFAALGSEADYPAFMVSHGYTEAATAPEVGQAEVDDFKEFQVPMLREWSTSPPTFETWQAEANAESEALLADGIPMSEVFIGSLGPMDLLFFALGIGTAFKVGSGGEYE